MEAGADMGPTGAARERERGRPGPTRTREKDAAPGKGERPDSSTTARRRNPVGSAKPRGTKEAAVSPGDRSGAGRRKTGKTQKRGRDGNGEGKEMPHEGGKAGDG